MKRIIITLMISVLIILAACSNNQNKEVQPDSVHKDELVLSIGGEVDNGFDPTTGWGLYGSPLFQSTLLTYDENFQIEFDLATAFEVSDDGLVYHFTLREDVVFSDEELLTADDVVFTFETAKNSASILDLSNVERIDKIADNEVEFHLKQPDSTFVTLLATTGIVPKHLYDEHYNEKPIGSGPYQLVQWDKDQQLIVEKNPHYYGDNGQFERLIFLFLSEDAAFAAAKAGEVDVVAVTPSFAKQKVKGMKLIELETVDNRGIVLPFLPEGEITETGAPIGNDVTADKAIRHAIDIGVDRQALVDGVLDGFGTKAYSVADNLPWWNEETVIDDANVEEAKQVLEEAGWALAADGIRSKDGVRASFELLYPSGDDIRQALALAMQDQMKALGIEIKTKDQSWNDLEQTMYANPVVMGWGSHDPIEMFNIYSSETRGQDFYNINYYTNETVDQHMEKAMRSTSMEEANEHWKNAQWDGVTGFSSLGDAPWVWLVNLTHTYFVDENLLIGKQKIQPHGHGWPITDFIHKWKWQD